MSIERYRTPAQAERVYQNLGLALAAAGATFADVIKLSAFVADITILPALREARDRYIDVANPPASTAVEVRALFQPGYAIEVEALAVLP
jgi:enamine deaminase RidA (YjgF/YER057c/UK114 family)